MQKLCAPPGGGTSRPADERSQTSARTGVTPLPKMLSRYFLVGAGEAGGIAVFGEPCGTGVGGGFTSCNSTSKIRVEFGPMSGPIARSPYARFDGINN